MTPQRARWLAVGAVLVASAAAQGLGLVEALRYERAAVTDGQIWRLVTAHIVHLGPKHLLLNAAGLVLVTALVGMYLRLSAWGLAFGLSALAVGAGLWLAAPDLRWYVGLSGVLHGLLVTGTIAALGHRRERPFAAALLAIVVGKLVWEQTVGSMPATAGLAGGAVVVDAHLFGAIGGGLAAAAVIPWGKRGPGAGSTSGP